MDAALRQRLLASIFTDDLVVFCGAGLSIASPSELPSARAIAEHCANQYLLNTGASLPADVANDLGRMASHFKGLQEFESVFISSLVPWSRFRGETNEGHRAIADMLGCKAIQFSITTNFDDLIETAATALGEPDFRAAVVPSDLQHSQPPHAPLLKFTAAGSEIDTRLFGAKNS